jgi:hypothetical protein
MFVKLKEFGSVLCCSLVCYVLIISFVTYWDLIVAFVCCCYDEVIFFRY